MMGVFTWTGADEIAKAIAEEKATAIIGQLRKVTRRARFEDFDMLHSGNAVVHVYTKCRWESVEIWFHRAGGEITHYIWMKSLGCYRIVFRAADLEK